MIRDLSILNNIKSEWEGVENMRNRLEADAMASFALPVLGGYYPFDLAKAAQNLPFVHACSVLNEVLIAIEAEGRFVCKSKYLGALLKSSKNALPWISYSLIEKAVHDRNSIAHRGELLEQDVCSKYVNGIRIELVNLGIVA